MRVIHCPTSMILVLMPWMFFLKFLQVNGVAELHSSILKSELFADYVSLWPSKFQNKTNGITSRRWLRFCNPELSAVITKWLKTDEWITDLDLLTGLRKVCLRIFDTLFNDLFIYYNSRLSVCFNSLLIMRNCNLNGHQRKWLTKIASQNMSPK